MLRASLQMHFPSQQWSRPMVGLWQAAMCVRLRSYCRLTGRTLGRLFLRDLCSLQPARALFNHRADAPHARSIHESFPSMSFPTGNQPGFPHTVATQDIGLDRVHSTRSGTFQSLLTITRPVSDKSQLQSHGYFGVFHCIIV